VSTEAQRPASAPSRTQAERRATTESRLLDAAYEIVAEHGVRAVTTAAVGQRAGYSRGIVNHHFGSRSALMLRLAELAQARFTPEPGDRRGRDRVLAVVDEYLGLARADAPSLRVFLRLWAVAVSGEEPDLSDAFTARDAFFRDYFRDAILEGVADGSIHGDVDAQATAVAVVGLIRGIAMQGQYDPDLAHDDATRAAARALLDRGLRPH